MKAYEILAERQQLNEFAPLVIGGLAVTWGVVLTTVSTALTAYGAYETYQFMQKRQFNIDNMTDEDWDVLSIDLALMLVPGLAKIGKSALTKYLPASFKSKLVNIVKPLVQKKMTPEVRAQLAKDLRVNSAARKSALSKGPITAEDLAKFAKADANAKAAALKAMSRFNVSAKAVIEMAGVGYAANNYWTAMKHLEADYNLELATPGTSQHFAAAKGDQGTAATMFREASDIALGTLVAEVGVLIVPGFGAKFFTGLGKATSGVLGWIPVVGGPARLAGGTSKLIGKILAAVNKPLATTAGKAGLAARGTALVWLDTADGKEFLKNNIVAGILGFTGATARKFLEAAGKFAEKFGITAISKAVSTVTKGDIKPNTPASGTSGQATADNPAGTPWFLTVTRDSSNPKKIFINNIPVTSDDGYLIPGGKVHFDEIARDAARYSLPNPIERLGLKPRP